MSDIRDKRELRNEDTLSTATFYRRANPVELSLFTNMFWTDDEKSNFMRDPPLVNAINQGNWDIAKLKAIAHLKANILLLNKVGKLLREEPTLGRAIAMTEFIFVDGVNVRKLIDDLGYLILLNVSKIPIPIHEICNAVELSNYPFVYSRLKFDERKWLRL